MMRISQRRNVQFAASKQVHRARQKAAELQRSRLSENAICTFCDVSHRLIWFALSPNAHPEPVDEVGAKFGLSENWLNSAAYLQNQTICNKNEGTSSLIKYKTRKN